MTQMQRVGKTATTISKGADGVTRVTYHSTNVVSFNEQYILLDTGGWQTYMTKTRMNQTANQFGLCFTVHQHKGEWNVNTFKPWNGKIASIYYKSWEDCKYSLCVINRKTGSITIMKNVVNIKDFIS